MHRQELLNLLSSHQTPFMDEAAYLKRAHDFVMQHPNCFDRDLQPGHVTGSAWVVNPARSHALLLHHRKHDQWFQPGAHADSDADILRVALRETSEMFVSWWRLMIAWPYWVMMNPMTLSGCPWLESPVLIIIVRPTGWLRKPGVCGPLPDE